MSFEKQNGEMEQAPKASRCVEISSQGELEIILPYLLVWLKRQEVVELLYASASVEREVQELQASYPKQLRVLRLPLLTFKNFQWPMSFKDTTLSRWVTADRLYLVRYDFYPEILALTLGTKKSLYLINGTLKNKSVHGIFFRLYLKPIFTLFSHIVVPTRKDLLSFKDLGIKEEKLSILETRPLRIFERLGDQQFFSQKIPGWPIVNEFIQKRSGLKLIAGSVWPSDLEILLTDLFIQEFQSGRSLCFLFPHKLDSKSLSSLEKVIWQLAPGLKIHYLKTGQVAECQRLVTEFSSRPGLVLVLVKGILCEAYKPFEVAYVGGGFERSIHSLLEPWVSQLHLYCGPKTHRSTEYDLILESTPNVVTVLADSQEWDKQLSKLLQNRSLEKIIWPEGYSERALTEKLETVASII